jgi:hypothetical protein
MHILAYFLVVGSILFGAIYFAEDALGPAGKMPLTTDFAGLPKRHVPKDAIQILTVREIPASVNNEVPAPGLKASAALPEPNATKVAVAPKKNPQLARTRNPAFSREPTIRFAQTPARERLW